MKKSKVYSWRLSSERLQGLERAARSRKRSLSSLLDEIASEWLAANAPHVDQRRLHQAAATWIGSIHGLGFDAADASRRVKDVIRAKHEREMKGNGHGRSHAR